MNTKLLLVIAAGLSVVAASSAADKSSKKNDAAKKTAAVELWNPPTMAKPLSAYSHVVEITGGKLVFIAGQLGNDESGKMVSSTDFRAQVEQAFKNIKAAVEAAGGDMTNVVKTNYYVAEAVDAQQLPALREVRDKYINMSAPPASTFVVVKRLARPDILVEIEAVAVVGSRMRVHLRNPRISEGEQ